MSSYLSQIILTDGLTVLGSYILGSYVDSSLLVGIVIPSTLTFIADYAFYGATALSNIIFAVGLTILGNNMFDMYDSGYRTTTSLLVVTIPSTITRYILLAL